MKKWLLPMSMLLATSTALAGCYGGGGEGETSSSSEGGTSTDIKQEMVVNAMSEPPAIDPALATDTTSGWVLDHIFEGLYTRDKEGNPVLGAASDVTVSEDGKTYTFKLREDAKWSDGSPVTAGDFEYAWERVLNPETGSAFAFYLYYIKGAEAYNKGEGNVEDVGIKAVDDTTFEVELNAPLGYFDSLLTLWTFYPVQQKAVEENKNWAAEADTYVSNGPFEMTEWQHDSNVVIEKNDDYYATDEVKLEKVTFELVNEASTYYQMFKTGELDLVMTLPTDVIATEKENPEYMEVPYYGTYMYMFNVEKEPFTNAKVRKAFAMAVDRQALVENVTQAGETPAFAMVPTGAETAEGDFREAGGNYFEENAEEAKKLLEEGMAEEGWDTLPEVTLMYNTLESNKKMAEAVQEMLSANLDVNVKLANQEWGTYLETTKQGNFQMARMGWIGIFVDPVVNLDYYLGDSPNNRTGWVNEEFDSLMADAKVEQDENKRFEMLHQAEEILMTDMPFMPVYFYKNTYMVSQDYENIAYYVNRYPYLKWAEKTK
ncbi:peptide ABC transporter substrate-binding protein [Planomicrobium sp. CPCC 101079]|uniref:peptide ABC transporter substrate-binding protein n=1 Tax=Planomicrobium sp. CPCC 101079 TaxID=2599618 RepID=UPI0011B716A2|nr:peptide ABC transporter substrate-binding protein [Planomicrobium sp. CPCC 101079]TWT14554.1 peptide ABC transporter substrate-binding protein [Planomicrobium sp. CPCC 101079]